MSGGRRIVARGFGALASAALLGAGIVSFVFDGYLIPSDSMAPTLRRGDHVLARARWLGQAERSDIVIFESSLGGAAVGETRIGRVVAVGGDRVGEADGGLTVDDEVAAEPSLPEGAVTTGIDPLTVPDGAVYVMGDNRMNSRDSRFYGPVPEADIGAHLALVNIRLDLMMLGVAGACGLVVAVVLLWPRRDRPRPPEFDPWPDD
ncbi:MAG: signal peptidase I [Acidimicrobiales bacterium]